MKAAVFYEPHVPVTVEELDLEDPRTGEVLVDLVGGGVCHSDYHYVSGHRSPPNTPQVLGHEGAGIVRQVGDGVVAVAPGDRVIFSMDRMCGHCRNCTDGRPTFCETYPRSDSMPDGTTRFSKDGMPYYHLVGTFSQQTVVPADQVVKVRDDAPLEKACLIGCAVITGVGAVVNRAKVEAGATTVVFGCGGVGLNVVQGAVISAASKIIAVDTVDFKLSKAEEMGATHLVNADKEDAVRRVNEITGGGADYAFEVVGFPSIAEQAFSCVRPGGTAVVVGVQPSGSKISVDGWELLQDRALLGSYHGTATVRTDFPWLLDLYMDGRLKLDELITKYRPLDEINEAYEEMNQGIIARTVLTFD